MRHTKGDIVTIVGIDGTDFTIDGQPTYTGRTFEGHRIEGLMFNVRAVQATFDDANPATRGVWAYPDTGEWDPDRNVNEFCAALESWKARGILAFTINVQGGGAVYTPDVYHHYDNNGFTPDGQLKPAYAARIEKVLARADELGMVAIVGMFYAMHVLKMDGERAIHRAADATMRFLAGTGRKNVLIEIANEIEVVVNRTGMDLFHKDNVHQIISPLRRDYPDFLYSTSQGGVNPETGDSMPSPSLIQAVDFLMPHGNNATPDQLSTALKMIQIMPDYQANPKPILINEDSPAVQNLDVAWRNHVSWGYYEQGYGSEEYGGTIWVDWRGIPREDRYEALSGYQTPPVNWGINTDSKRAFFDRVAEVTGRS